MSRDSDPAQEGRDNEYTSATEHGAWAGDNQKQGPLLPGGEGGNRSSSEQDTDDGEKGSRCGENGSGHRRDKTPPPRGSAPGAKKGVTEMGVTLSPWSSKWVADRVDAHVGAGAERIEAHRLALDELALQKTALFEEEQLSQRVEALERGERILAVQQREQKEEAERLAAKKKEGEVEKRKMRAEWADREKDVERRELRLKETKVKGSLPVRNDGGRGHEDDLDERRENLQSRARVSGSPHAAT